MAVGDKVNVSMRSNGFLALSKLPCFTHRTSLTLGDADGVEPRCLRDHCFRSYVQVSAGSRAAGSRYPKRRKRFCPVGFLYGLQLLQRTTMTGDACEIFFAGFLFLSDERFLQRRVWGIHGRASVCLESVGGAWYMAGMGLRRGGILR